MLSGDAFHFHALFGICEFCRQQWMLQSYHEFLLLNVFGNGKTKTFQNQRRYHSFPLSVFTSKSSKRRRDFINRFSTWSQEKMSSNGRANLWERNHEYLETNPVQIAKLTMRFPWKTKFHAHTTMTMTDLFQHQVPSHSFQVKQDPFKRHRQRSDSLRLV